MKGPTAAQVDSRTCKGLGMTMNYGARCAIIPFLLGDGSDNAFVVFGG